MFKVSFLRARFTTLALLLLISSLLAACGGDNSTATPAPPTPAPGAANTPAAGGNPVITVTLTEWSISPKTINVSAGHVKFNVVNSGQFPHNFGVVVNGKDMKTANIDPGSSGSLELDLTAGTYDTLCDIPTHKDKGMAGSVVVQ